VSGKDRKNTGDERKDRLAAELRANLKRRKAKGGKLRTPQAKKVDEAETR
jgi:hypothetical protein